MASITSKKQEDTPILDVIKTLPIDQLYQTCCEVFLVRSEVIQAPDLLAKLAANPEKYENYKKQLTDAPDSMPLNQARYADQISGAYLKLLWEQFSDVRNETVLNGILPEERNDLVRSHPIPTSTLPRVSTSSLLAANPSPEPGERSCCSSMKNRYCR